MNPHGDIAVIADAYEGRRLNSPNDVVCRSDGSVWFTDPPFGLPEHWRTTWTASSTSAASSASPDGRSR